MALCVHLLLSPLFPSCSGPAVLTKSGSDLNAPLTYKLYGKNNEKECTTGRITATDIKVLCQALRNDEVNQNCAADERLELQRKYNCAAQAQVEISSYYFGACEKSVGVVHHVASAEAQCEALKDEKLNAGCAKEERLSQSASCR